MTTTATTHGASAAAANGAKRKKLNVEIRTVEAGQTFSGVFIGRSERPWLDDEGQAKTLTTVIFKELASDTRFGVFQDAGLKNQLDNAMVKEGMKLEVHKLDKKDLGGGRTVNQYDVYELN